MASEDGLFSLAVGLRGMFLYELDHNPNAEDRGRFESNDFGMMH